MGKLTEPAFKAASDEYLARLNKNFSVTVAEPKPEPLPQNPSDNAIKLALDKEADKILAEIPPRSALVAMCVEGKELSSEEFSQRTSRCPAFPRSRSSSARPTVCRIRSKTRLS